MSKTGIIFSLPKLALFEKLMQEHYRSAPSENNSTTNCFMVPTPKKARK
jgi:hypothetical protein